MKTPTVFSRAMILAAVFACSSLGCRKAWAGGPREGEFETDTRLDFARAQFAGDGPSRANAGVFSEQPTTTEATTDVDGGEPLSTPARIAFGDAGGHWGTVGFGITPSAYGDGVGYNPTFTYSYFLADGIEMAGELGGWYYDQDGDNAFAINPCAVIRWHFWRSETKDTTVYFDGRIGVLISDDKIPFDGTSFNFTPGFGFGATHKLTERWRLQAGIRWSHVSNARIRGEEDNPSRDGPLFYTGIIFAF